MIANAGFEEEFDKCRFFDSECKRNSIYADAQQKSLAIVETSINNARSQLRKHGRVLGIGYPSGSACNSQESSYQYAYERYSHLVSRQQCEQFTRKIVQQAWEEQLEIVKMEVEQENEVARSAEQQRRDQENEQRLAKQKETEQQAKIDSEKVLSAKTASGVDDDRAQELAGAMYRAYRYGGVGEMLRVENTCWSDFSEKWKGNKVAAGSCSLAAFAGVFIEASFARRQGRVSAPAYNGQIFRDRVLKNMTKAGMKPEQAEQILASVVSHQENIIYGLMNSGMR